MSEINWNLLAKVFGYACGVLIVVHILFSVGYGEKIFFTVFEVSILIMFVISELMCLIKKDEKKNR